MKQIILSVALVCALLSMHAQSVLSSAGGSVEGQNITIDWTIGEVITIGLDAHGAAATQGFQQPILVPEFTFADPCACDDPRNVIGRDGFVQRYHDQITIISSTGGVLSDAFEIIAILEGEVLTEDGTSIIDSPTAISSADGDNQVIDLWRVLGPRYRVTLENTITGERFEVATEIDCIPCPQIPSMGAWALFILFLTLTSIALIKLREVRFA